MYSVVGKQGYFAQRLEVQKLRNLPEARYMKAVVLKFYMISWMVRA